MGCRAQFWTLIGALALLWTCGGTFLAFSSAPQTGRRVMATLQPGSVDKDTENIATGNAALSGSAVYLCTGLPVLILASLFANGARRQYTEKKRHEELLAAQHQQTLALQQMATMQATQAAAQFARMQAAPVGSNVQVAIPPHVQSTLDQARQLIKDKQYKKARALLNGVDHPKAREWLATMDQRGL